MNKLKERKVNNEVEDLIYKQIDYLKVNKCLISRLKACTDRIVNKQTDYCVFVCSLEVTHFDLIAHLPILCEKNKIPCLFIKKLEQTCVLLEFDKNDYENIVGLI
ncbi:hypothetical protein A0H76_1629 [Hepatospora eriocheir]|uniref:NHP2 n=1 Tax=Hepatospora eriocheir TaxID=1081669 RepID=A0A1X0QGT4_9MICR|nr:hypothetical protein A0H76_1629 [Hepatospora eriocheir]